MCHPRGESEESMQVRKDAKNVLFTLALKSRVHIAKTDVHKIDLSPPNMLKKKSPKRVP